MWSPSFLKTVFFTFCRNQPSEDKEACVVCPGRKQEPACILQEWGRCPHWEIPPREPQSDWCSHLIGPGQQQPVYHSVSWGCLICLILLRSSFINIIIDSLFYASPSNSAILAFCFKSCFWNGWVRIYFSSLNIYVFYVYRYICSLFWSSAFTS